MTQGEPLPRIAVLASGRGTNLQAIIDAVSAGELAADITCVLSDRPGAMALERAERHGIPARCIDYRGMGDPPRYESELASALEALAPDLIVLSGYMRILPPRIVRRYPLRIINIHPSLLPAFPGLHPHAQALAYGVKVSGCTVHFVDEGVDSGPIIAQTAVPVYDDDTEDTLAQRILQEEHRLYPQVIAKVLAGTLEVAARRVRIQP